MPKYKRTRCGVSYLTTLTTVSILSLPWAAAAQTIDDARTSTVSSSGGDAEITITESGSISTSGILQQGISSSGESPTIINNGTITTDGPSSRGISSTGDGSTQDKTTIINNGTITTNDETSDGIIADGAEAIITNNGTITTLGSRSAGIRSTGNDAEIILGENGTITTSAELSGGGSGAHGIRSTHENAKITINGSIITTGEGGHGVQSTNVSSDDGVPDNAIITVGATGSITTSGNNAYGIRSEGTSATISNDGEITTSGERAHGIQATGADATISNDGDITTSGVDAEGIRATGADATISNDGDITTSGVDAEGIRATGADATISNTGEITTSGVGAKGIFSTGADATITNTGTITTSGNSAHGIRAADANATISNTGSITTSGENAGGIRSNGDDSTITNDGSMTTSGVDAEGIRATGANATISNTGSITTSGERAHGIRAADANATITLGATGAISTEGNEAHGIQATGDGAMITIEGKVSVSGEGAYVVHGGDDTNQILTLSAGAETQGEFNLGDSEGDNDVAKIWVNDTQSSSTFTIGGAETINLKNADQDARILRLPKLVSNTGDSVAVIDPTGSSATRIALGAMTGQIQRQVFQRLDARHPASMEGSGSWGTLFGIRSERNEDDLALAWSHRLYGATGGFDTTLDGDRRVGIVAGIGQDQIKTTEVTSIKDSATYAFAGAYGQQSMGRLNLDGSVVLGYARHDSARTVLDNLVGYEIADGEYNSAYISPSLALEWSEELGDWGTELRPSAKISYTYGYYGAYTETGTTNSNINFDSRSVNIVDGRLQLAVAQSFLDAQGEIELRGGATFTYYGEDSVGAHLGTGAPISYRIPGDETIPGGYAGVNMRYKIADAVTMGGDIEYAKTSGGEGAISGQLGLVFKF
ncbi:autotransporter outer membrane beta-barrel domain-containing protein [Kiloniella sp.]|uniref:autotransporter outer membrane beta-barrel domain-containing protein n=1 Tax=Kiloniella sp. TaxID=1938587 RepID=UPI003B0280FF